MWHTLVKAVNRLFAGLTMVFVVVMVVIIFIQIISRAIIGSSFSWTEELARILMIWVIFLGAGFAFQYGAHVSVETIVQRFPPNVQKIVPYFVFVASIIFLVVLLFKGIDITQRAMSQYTSALRLPMGYVYLAFPISAVLQIINLIDITVRFYRTGETVREEY